MIQEDRKDEKKIEYKAEKSHKNEEVEPISEIAQEIDGQQEIADEVVDEAVHIDEYTVPESIEHEPTGRIELEEKEETEEIFAVLEKADVEIDEEEEQELFGVLENATVNEEQAKDE